MRILLSLHVTAIFLPIPTTTAFGAIHQWSRHASPLRMIGTDDDGVGAARGLLFNDQHRALSDQAEFEAGLVTSMSEMEFCTAKSKPRSSKGGGFGGGGFGAKTKGKKKNQPRRLSAAIARLAEAAREDGVVRVPSVLTPSTASSLRSAILTELEYMRDDVRKDPSCSVDYFYVDATIHFSTKRGYILLPFRDRDSEDAPIVSAAKELLGPGTPLSSLFGELCGGSGVDPVLYDFCALRTEAGTARQVIHSDTPYQETPGLFCAFVALQDVSVPMGGTLFLPGTQLQTEERRHFDIGGSLKEDMLSNFDNARYVHLKAGDAVLFDMRVLHAGLPNLAEGGSKRILLAVTFRNPEARGELAHKPNLRPGYVGMYTLSSFQEELEREAPFVDAGTGLRADMKSTN